MTIDTFKNTQGGVFDCKINCRGCNFQFDAKNHKLKRPSLDFYVHCITECPEYAQLNLIAECRPCGFKFLTRKSAKRHFTSGFHRFREFRRDYIPNDLVSTNNDDSKFTKTSTCLGCRRKYPAEPRGKVNIPRIDFYVHCVEECSKFAKLGLLTKCKTCPLVFLSKGMADEHFCDGQSDRDGTSQASTSSSTIANEVDCDVDFIDFGNADEDSIEDATNNHWASEPHAPDFLTDFDLDDDIPELSLEANFPEAFEN